MKDVQRSFDLSIREGQVSSAANIQSCQVTDSKQPGTGIYLGSGEPSYQANIKMQTPSSPDLMVNNRPHSCRLCAVWRNPGQPDRKG